MPGLKSYGKFARLSLVLGLATLVSLLGAYVSRRWSRDEVSGSLVEVGREAALGTRRIGPFIVTLAVERYGSLNSIWLRVGHSSEPDRVLWESLPGKSCVSAALGQETVSETRAHYSVDDEVAEAYPDQTLDPIEKSGCAGRRREGNTALDGEPVQLLCTATGRATPSFVFSR